MAKFAIYAAKAATASAQNSTFYLPAYISYAVVQISSGEANIQRSFVAGTLSNIYVRITANSIAATSTLRSRVATANGAQSVSIGSTATGEFQDTTNTDAVTNGQQVNLSLVTGASGANTISIGVMGAAFAPTSGDTTCHAAAIVNATTVVNSTTYYYKHIGRVTGSSLPTTETADLQFKSKVAGVVDRMSVFVATARTTNTVHTNRIGGADGTLVVTTTASTTGLYEDLTHSDAIVAGSLLNSKFVTGTGSGSYSWTIYTRIATTDLSTMCASGLTAQSYAASAARYEGLNGTATTAANETTEANVQAPIGVACTVSQYEAYASANTIVGGGTIVFRKAAAPVNGSIAITGLTTGWFEDTTHSDALIATDEVNWLVTAGAAGTSMALEYIAAKIAQSTANTLTAAVGTYTVSGQAVTLTYASHNYTLAAAVGAYTLTGVAATLTVSTAIKLANAALIATAGGAAGWIGVYDARTGVTDVSGAASAWDDYDTTRTDAGPQLTQAVAGKRPTNTGTGLVFDPAQSQILASGQDARYAQSAVTTLVIFGTFLTTGDGCACALCADPTNSATAPQLAIKPAAGKWKGHALPTVTAFAPNSDTAWNDSVPRILGMGKLADTAQGGSANPKPQYVFWVDGRMAQVFDQPAVATAVGGGLKLCVGGLGAANYWGGTATHIAIYAGTDPVAAAIAYDAFSLAQFPTARRDTSRPYRIIFTGDSMAYGQGGADPKTAVVGSGTTTSVMVAAGLTTTKPTWALQGFDCLQAQACNQGWSTRQFQTFIDYMFTQEMKWAFVSVLSGTVPVFWFRCGVNNFNTNKTSVQVLANVTSITALIHGIGARAVYETQADFGGGYGAGAQRMVEALAYNTAMMVNGGAAVNNADGTALHDGCINTAANSRFTPGTSAYLDGTNYADDTHWTTVAQAAAATDNDRPFFDANGQLFVAASGGSLVFDSSSYMRLMMRRRRKR